jgi:hypothetical protein
MRIPLELTVVFVGGLFGLAPLIVQLATARAQRRDRMARLNQLRAELELLERLHTLQGEVTTTDEAAKPQTNVVIRDSLSKVLEQYNQLSEIPISAVAGGKPPSTQQLSFLRRAFLLYNPHMASGWIMHTLFYMIAFVLVFVSIGEIFVGILNGDTGAGLQYAALAVVVLGIPMLIIQRLARRNAAQLGERNV